MKHKIEKLQDSVISLIEIALLIVALLLPQIIKVTTYIKLCFENIDINFDNIKYYFLLKAGDWAIGLLLFIIVLFRIRAFNKDRLFNTKNYYHDYSYIWYFLCSKVLGYKKCNLKLVPIFMQFKLILNDTFREYHIGMEDEYPILENEQIDVKTINISHTINEANLVLADTYPVVENQLPRNKRALPTIIISRNRGDFNRYFSQFFVTQIVNEVRKLPRNVNCLNIFATTNPKHNLSIANGVFKLGNRGNIEILTVFQQEAKGSRKFGRKGIVIFGKM